MPQSSLPLTRASPLSLSSTHTHMAMKVSFLLFLHFVYGVSAIPPSVRPLEGLLPNGNFEEAPNPKDMRKTMIQGRYALPRWEINGSVEYVSGGPQPGGTYYAVAHGVHAIRLGSKASISQIVPLRNGSMYALTFSASRTCAQDEVLRVLVGGQTGDLPLQTIYSSSGGDTYAWGFTACSNAVNITFHNPAAREDAACGPLLDAVAIKELYHPRATIVNLVKNNGFEEGPHILINASHGVLLPPQQECFSSPLPGWIIQSLKAVKFIDSDHFGVPYGKSAIELVAGRESAVSQIIRTIPNRTYTLSFAIGDAKNGCHGSMMVEAYAAREAMKASFRSEGKGQFSTYSFQFTAESNRTRLIFLSSFYHTRITDSGTLCGPVLDEVHVFPAARI